MPVTITNDQWDGREFLLAIEGTEGEAETLDPASHAYIIHDGESQIEVEERVLERDRPDGGGRPRVYVRRHGVVTGQVELTGAATAGDASPYSPLYRNAGHAEQLVDEAGPPEIKAADYTPVLRGFPSATAEFFHDGELQRMVGARGILESMRWSLDEFNSAGWRLMGLVEAIEEAALPANADKSAFQMPQVGTQANMTVTLDGTALDAVSLELSNGGQLGMRYGTESTLTLHRSRDWTGTLRIWRPLIADSDIRAMVRSHAQVPLVLDYEDDAAANKANLLLPTVQLGEPRRVNVDGSKAWDVPVVAVNAGLDYRLRFGGEVPA